MLKKPVRLGLAALMLLAVAVAAVACGGDDADDGAIIKSIVMTKEVKGDKFEPGKTTTVFGPNDTVHAVVGIRKAPKDTVFQARWSVVDVGEAADPGQEIDVVEVTAEGSRNIDFDLKPTSQWPVGTYRVEISVDGVVEQALDWSVE